MNALTQYCDSVYFPELVKKQNEIAFQIQTYFAKIKDLIPHHSYVIDFILFPDGEIKVIELNPFGEMTGAGMFSWEDDYEKIINGPFEFRIRKEPKLTVHVPYPWEKYFETFKPKECQTQKIDSDQSFCCIQ